MPNAIEERRYLQKQLLRRVNIETREVQLVNYIVLTEETPNLDGTRIDMNNLGQHHEMTPALQEAILEAARKAGKSTMAVEYALARGEKVGLPGG